MEVSLGVERVMVGVVLVVMMLVVVMVEVEEASVIFVLHV